MTEQLNSLVIDAIDELECLFYYRQLLDVAQEQLEKKNKSLDRLDILLSVYLSNFECHMENLQSALNQIKKLLETAKISHQLRKQPENFRGGCSNQSILPSHLSHRPSHES